MRILFVIFFCLLWSSLWAESALMNMPPNRAFMKLYLSRYLEWHEKKFPSPYSSLKGGEKVFVDSVISHIDHWKVPDQREQKQISFEYKVQEGEIKQTLKVFIHPEDRTNPFVQKLRLPSQFSPAYYIVTTKDRCFEGTLNASKELKILCRQVDTSPFVLGGMEKLSETLTNPWPNPFPYFLSWEIQRFDSKGELDSIIYESPGTHISRFPKELHLVIGLHVLDAGLGLSRYSVSRKGNLSVFYP